MHKYTFGIVVSMQKQYNMINHNISSKKYDLFSNIHPYLVEVQYMVNGKRYTKKRLCSVIPHLHIGSTVNVKYDPANPVKCTVKIL